MTGDRPDTVEIERKKVTTMLHQLTVTRERESLTPVGDEHLKTACEWLDEALIESSEDVEFTDVEREMVAFTIDILADLGRGYTDHSEQTYEDAARSLIHDVDGTSWEDAGYRTEESS